MQINSAELKEKKKAVHTNYLSSQLRDLSHSELLSEGLSMELGGCQEVKSKAENYWEINGARLGVLY